MIQYLIANKEWIFSGIGVVAISWLWNSITKRKNNSKKIIQKSGDNSTNIQIGGDIKNYFQDNDRGN